MNRKKLSHLQIIALGYFIMIAVGTALLLLPFSTRAVGGADFLTALFTATSASCVTGLVLQDTGTYWSVFGQFVIIFLIQIGGLGFMTIATFFFRMINKKAGLRERAVMAESINTTRIGGMQALTKRIVAGTALFEICGAVLLSIRFVPQFGLFKGIYFGFFHSVSAFCNAGFDLLGANKPYSSLTGYSGDIIVNVTIMALIIIGGIGFIVWDDIVKARFRFKRLPLHTKLVLTVTLVLVLGGGLLIFIFERNNLCADMSVKKKILTSLFGSVTARTAGFNTTDTGALSQSSKLLTMVLMFIGGSPGSTAGGIKTTTAAIILICLFTSVRGQSNLHAFGRKIESDVLKKAIIIISINFILAFAGILTICAVQNLNATDVCFEAMSAIGTVGMTTGITRDLTGVSRVVIIFLMYCGRVGSISFASALFEKRIRPPVSYPAEPVTIG